MSSEKGFTLIELLVSMTLVAILSAMAIPHFSTYKKKALEAELANHGHSAATAGFAAMMEFGDDMVNASVEGRTEINGLPGMPQLPEHIGGYIRVYERISPRGFSQALSLQLCSSKLAEEGRTKTFRYREFATGDTVGTPIYGMQPFEDSFTEVECASYM